MDTNVFEQYRKNLKNFQEQVVKMSIASFPGGSKQSDAFSPMKAALNLQESWMNAAFKAQETGISMALGAQQQMSRSYFKMLRKSFFIKDKE